VLVTIWVMVMLLLVLWVFGAPRKLAPVRVSDGAESVSWKQVIVAPETVRGQGRARLRPLFHSRLDVLQALYD